MDRDILHTVGKEEMIFVETVGYALNKRTRSGVGTGSGNLVGREPVPLPR